MGIRAAIKNFTVIAVMAALPLAGTFHPCFAGAWTLPEGKAYDKLSLNEYSADSYFTDLNIGNYVEYGITDTLSLVNSIYFKQIKSKYDSTASSTTTTTTTAGMADIEIGLKQKLAEGAYGIFSHQALVKIPGPYDKKSALPLGNGQFDLEYRFLYGISLWRLFPGYANFEAGYRFRSEAPADEFRYLAEVGVDITKRLYARVKLDGILSANNADRMADQSGNPTTIYQYDLQKIDSAVGYKLTDNWGLELGYTPTLYAKNTAEGTTYSVGVTYLLR